MPTYPARQCPACEFWFLPLSHNTVACSVKCANRIKALQRKSRSTTYIRSPTVQPTQPVPAIMRQEAYADLGLDPVQKEMAVTAEQALEKLGYSSRPRGEPSPETQPPAGGASVDPNAPTAPEAQYTSIRLACGHRDIGVRPCPLCLPPILSDPQEN